MAGRAVTKWPRAPVLAIALLAQAAICGSLRSEELPGAGNPLWAIPLSQLSATRERPLFSASRRPPPPPAPAVAAAPMVKPPAPEVPPFVLVGTLIGEDQRIGIFRNEAANVTTRLREGETDSGWTLRSLDPRSAVLEGEGRMATLNLPEPGAAGAGAAAASAYDAGIFDDSPGPPVSVAAKPPRGPRDGL
jgi:general secretion pathway protein N